MNKTLNHLPFSLSFSNEEAVQCNRVFVFKSVFNRKVLLCLTS